MPTRFSTPLSHRVVSTTASSPTENLFRTGQFTPFLLFLVANHLRYFNKQEVVPQRQKACNKGRSMQDCSSQPSVVASGSGSVAENIRHVDRDSVLLSGPEHEHRICPRETEQ